MENKKETEKKVMYVYNIAVRRLDKVMEQDTLYCDKLLKEQDVKDISEKFNADVLLSCIGTLQYADDKFVKDNTFCVMLPKPEPVDENTAKYLAEEKRLEKLGAVKNLKEEN